MGGNKKFQKNKESKNRLKDKESKKMKEKSIKKEIDEKIEESPRQRKPGKKVQFLNDTSNMDSSENEKSKKHTNLVKDSLLDLDNSDKYLINKNTKKKRKKKNLSS